MEPPVTQSPFFFAPWPWYIPILDAAALLLVAFLIHKPRRLSEAGSDA